MQRFNNIPKKSVNIPMYDEDSKHSNILNQQDKTGSSSHRNIGAGGLNCPEAYSQKLGKFSKYKKKMSGQKVTQVL